MHVMRSISVVTITIILASTSFAQTKRAMTIDDLITAVRIGDPQISPDGKTLALATGEKDESIIEIWDIPPRRPMWWVLGLLAIPSVVTLITLLRIRQRLFWGRNREEAASETAS